MIASFETSWILLSSIFQQWHTWLALALIFCTFVLRQQYRSEAFNCLYVVNLLLPWFVLGDFLLLLTSLFIAWLGTSSYESYAFFQHPVFGLQLQYALFFATSLVTFLFFIKAIRIHRFAILLILLLRNSSCICLKLGEIFVDYLPSSWSVTGDPLPVLLVKYVWLISLLTGAYWWLFKRNKLPYPSIFKR